MEIFIDFRVFQEILKTDLTNMSICQINLFYKNLEIGLYKKIIIENRKTDDTYLKNITFTRNSHFHITCCFNFFNYQNERLLSH